MIRDESMSLTTVTDESSPVRTDAPSEWSVTLAEESRGPGPWIFDQQQLSWTSGRALLRCLGSGGQGVVYLSERRGADGFVLPVALKFFSPEPYPDDQSYDAGMARIAHVAARVAGIQQDHLVDVQDFVEHNGIRIMEMEWIDGFDLQRLLSMRALEQVREAAGDARWRYINDVIASAGPEQARLKPGIAVAILRDCLGALAALHRAGIVHSDVKPSNMMVKRTGSVKMIDTGSSFALEQPPREQVCTPAYAAPEVLQGTVASPKSDLASLGYVFVEMLAGRRCFAGQRHNTILRAKKRLRLLLPEMLPEQVAGNELLMALVDGLVHPDPGGRFANAEIAEEQAGQFQRQLVKGNLASEYGTDIRCWVEVLD
jgi:serine/threonine protein kinase